MATKNTGSVFQKDNGYWGYRFVVKIDGKRIERKCSFDEHGNKFRTKKEAAAARAAAIVNLRIEKTERPKITRRTVKEVFDEFCAEGRKDRAYMTIRKQDSIWEKHLRLVILNSVTIDCRNGEIDPMSMAFFTDGGSFL